MNAYSRAVDVFAFGATALWLLNEGVLPSEFSDMPPTNDRAFPIVKVAPPQEA